jgi:autotransporter-associated beta strand protein
MWCAIVVLLAPVFACAQFTWTGGGTGASSLNFSNSANWGGTPLVTTGASTLTFAGSINTGSAAHKLNQDAGNPLFFSSMTFAAGAGAFFITGSKFGVDNGGATIVQSAASDQFLDNPITSFASANTTRLLTLTGTAGGSGVVTLGGSLGDNGTRKLAVAKTGAGSTYVLATFNGFSGGLTLSAGTLVIADAAALGNGTLAAAGGTLLLASSSPLAFTGAATVSADTTLLASVKTPGPALTHTLGDLSINASKLSILAGANVTSGTAGVTFGATTFTTSGATLDVGAGANLTLGALTGNVAFTKQGDGTLTLGTASTRMGQTLINGGTVRLGSATGLGSGSVSIAGGTLDVAAFSAPVSSLTLSGGNVVGGTGALALGGNVVSAGASAIASRVSLGATRSFDVTSTLTLSNAISGSGFGINKTGGGTLILGGTSSYTGATSVTGGRLVVNGTLSTAAGAVSAGDGINPDSGTLAGAGTIQRSVSIAKGGSIAPGAGGSAGNGVGILRTNGQTWSGEGTYVVTIADASDTSSAAAGAKFSQLQLSGALTLGATSLSRFVFDLTSLDALGANGNALNFDKSRNYDWKIATTTSAAPDFTDRFTLIDHFTNDTSGVGSAPDGGFSITGSGNDVVLHYTAAPEPGMVGVIGLATVALLRRGRRAACGVK